MVQGAAIVRHYRRTPDVLKSYRTAGNQTSDRLPLTRRKKLSSAKFLVCFKFQSASKSLKIDENVVRVSNSLDPDETPSYSASHPDPSCLHMALWSRLAGKGLKRQQIGVPLSLSSKGIYILYWFPNTVFEVCETPFPKLNFYF